MNKPFSLVAELTYRCPLACPYCSNPIDWSSNKYRQELNTDEWLHVIEQARSLGVLQLGISGGEPLLRQDLEILVEKAANLGLYTTLVTAATFLNQQRATKLREIGLDHIQISIQDSRPTESDRIAGITSFEEKIAAARLVKELGFPLTLNFVLHSQNLDRIEEILELAETLQADRLELANTQYYGWAFKNRAALLPSPQQLLKAEQAVIAAQKRRKIPMGIIYVIPDYYAEYPKPCMGGWGERTIVITPNGDALPCQAASIISSLEFANIRQHTLEWIWYNSATFNRFRGTDWMSEPCQSCELRNDKGILRRDIDRGGCRCQAFAIAQDENATDPVCHLSPHHDRIRRTCADRTQSEQNFSLSYRQK